MSGYQIGGLDMSSTLVEKVYALRGLPHDWNGPDSHSIDVRILRFATFFAAFIDRRLCGMNSASHPHVSPGASGSVNF